MPGAGARRRGGAGASSVLPARASRRSPREVPPSALRSVCTTRTAALFETRRIYFRYTDLPLFTRHARSYKQLFGGIRRDHR